MSFSGKYLQDLIINQLKLLVAQLELFDVNEADFPDLTVGLNGQ